MHESFLEILALYICPTLGCILSFAMFVAPCPSLYRALRQGNLGDLVPFPWAVGLGNCYGWVLYGYFQQDIFIMASNIPGFLLSIWLNHGAAKLQYYQKWQDSITLEYQNQDVQIATPNPAGDHTSSASSGSSDENSGKNETSDNDEDNYGIQAWVNDSLVAHEKNLFLIILFWTGFSIYVGWISSSTETSSLLLGWTVNLNLIFFYGAPLQIVRQVWKTKDSTPIHRPSLATTFCNSAFWVIYGLAVHNDFIIVPNVAGCLLGLIQVILCICCPRPPPESSNASKSQALLSIVQKQSVFPEPSWGIMV